MPEPHPSPASGTASASFADALPSGIGEALANGTTVLTATEPAAAALRARFQEAQSAAGLRAWQPAAIHSWHTWLQSLWSGLITDGAESRHLLNPAQEHLVWRDIIATGPVSGSLDSSDALAALAAAAFRLAADYNSLDDLRRFALTHDARTFAAWAAAFRKRCAQRQYLSAAELPSALRIHIENATLTPPSRLLLLGFDDDLPARDSLLTTIAAHGCEIQRLTIEAPAFTALSSENLHVIARAANPHEEALAAARWMRQFIIARAAANLPHRVALIVPSLSDVRADLETVLRSVLAPELDSIAADLSSAPFAFSTGAPLAQTALAAAALDLLRWIAQPLPLDRVSALLLSPYLGSSSTLEARAAFDAFKLRRAPTLRPEIALPRIARLAETCRVEHPATAALLLPLVPRTSGLDKSTRSYADWMEFFRDVLHDASFPGDRPLNAEEFRNARTWDHVLDAVATLDFAGSRVDFRAALEAVERQAATASSAHGTSDAAVQVMSPSEAAGTAFDAIVFLRSTDANWPAPERANPLLGWPLQQERRMPGADPALTTARAEQATARLIAASPNVLFFYAAEDESGPQRLSPIVERLGWSHIAAADLAPASPPAPIALEEIPDAAHLPPLPSDLVPGGARVLKQQAACGFLAFSEFRLRSRPLDAPSAGLDAVESGNFLHRAMQAFWQEAKSQDDLRRMDPSARESLLSRSIDAALSSRLHPETDWDRAYLQLQKDRLFILLRFWLNAELERGPFTVLALEAATPITVGPLTLSVRIDRIDRVTDGFVYVDYKTGYAGKTRDWETERPDDPQLPLYALLSEPGELKGLAFAKVRAGNDMAWNGFQADAGILPMKRPSTVDLDLLIEEWRQNLTMLAEDFAAGRATVSPKSFAINCARCAQRLLCRVNPELLLAPAADDAAEDFE